MQTQITGSTVVQLKKAEASVTVDFDKMPQASKDHVVAYGIRQILNDAMASAKTKAEAEGMYAKRLDNLMSGTLRASPQREGNPVRKRALELAMDAVMKSAKFIQWMKDNGLKTSSKEAIKAARVNGLRHIEVEGNRFTAQAEIDVANAKALEVDDMDLDLGDIADESDDEGEE